MQFFKDVFSRLKNWLGSKPESEMGRFRLKEAAAIAVVLFVAAYLLDSDMFIGWFSQALLQFSKAGAAAFMFYWVVQRRVLHSRTHELSPDQQAVRENFLAVCYALIIACSLAI